MPGPCTKVCGAVAAVGRIIFMTSVIAFHILCLPLLAAAGMVVALYPPLHLDAVSSSLDNLHRLASDGKSECVSPVGVVDVLSLFAVEGNGCHYRTMMTRVANGIPNAFDTLISGSEGTDDTNEERCNPMSNSALKMCDTESPFDNQDARNLVSVFVGSSPIFRKVTVALHTACNGFGEAHLETAPGCAKYNASYHTLAKASAVSDQMIIDAASGDNVFSSYPLYGFVDMVNALLLASIWSHPSIPEAVSFTLPSTWSQPQSCVSIFLEGDDGDFCTESQLLDSKIELLSATLSNVSRVGGTSPLPCPGTGANANHEAFLHRSESENALLAAACSVAHSVRPFSDGMLVDDLAMTNLAEVSLSALLEPNGWNRYKLFKLSQHPSSCDISSSNYKVAMEEEDNLSRASLSECEWPKQQLLTGGIRLGTSIPWVVFCAGLGSYVFIIAMFSLLPFLLSLQFRIDIPRPAMQAIKLYPHKRGLYANIVILLVFLVVLLLTFLELGGDEEMQIYGGDVCDSEYDTDTAGEGSFPLLFAKTKIESPSFWEAMPFSTSAVFSAACWIAACAWIRFLYAIFVRQSSGTPNDQDDKIAVVRIGLYVALPTLILASFFTPFIYKAVEGEEVCDYLETIIDSGGSAENARLNADEMIDHYRLCALTATISGSSLGLLFTRSLFKIDADTGGFYYWFTPALFVWAAVQGAWIYFVAKVNKDFWPLHVSYGLFMVVFLVCVWVTRNKDWGPCGKRFKEKAEKGFARFKNPFVRRGDEGEPEAVMSSKSRAQAHSERLPAIFLKAGLV